MRTPIEHRHALINLGCTVLLVVLTWIDYVTGYEFGFFIFYFIPVSIAAWYVGRRSGLAFAFASGVAWYLSDRLSLHPYSKAFFIYWETFMRLVSFLTTALTLNKIRELASAHVQLRDSLREAHEENVDLRRKLEQAALGRENASGRPPDA
jgi:low affinity Fe/Cu permease